MTEVEDIKIGRKGSKIFPNTISLFIGIVLVYKDWKGFSMQVFILDYFI